MRSTKFFSSFVAAALGVTLAACGDVGTGSDSSGGEGGESASVDTSRITFGAASQGGFWYVFATTLGNKMEKELGSTVGVIEGGSLANIQGIASGQFQVGLTNGQSIPAALEGTGGFEKSLDGFTGVAGLYPNVMQIVVREDSGIKSVEDLAGKRVSPGIKGYSGEVAFQQILEQNDMGYDDLDQIEYLPTSDGATQLRDGQIDALALMLVTPQATISELESTLGIDVLSLSAETISGMREANPGYKEHTIPEGTYGDSEKVTTVAAPSVMLVAENLPEDYVYDLTQLLVESKDTWASLNPAMKDWDADFAQKNVPEVLPLHPGAEQYYDEVNSK